MAKDLIENLQQSEAMWRANDPAWNRRIKQWEQWKLRAKDRERMAQREKKFKDDASEPTTIKEKSWESSFDPEDPSPQFSFAGFNKSYSKDDLNEDLGWWKLDQWMIDGLRRGIAVHHAGMNKRYRSVVER
jgi:ATP-dependent RNA helicase DDX60